MAALPLVYQVYQESGTVYMLLVEVGLEKVCREGLRLAVSLGVMVPSSGASMLINNHTQVYDRVFHDFTLDLHVILSSLTLSVLKTY